LKLSLVVDALGKRHHLATLGRIPWTAQAQRLQAPPAFVHNIQVKIAPLLSHFNTRVLPLLAGSLVYIESTFLLQVDYKMKQKKQ